MAAADPYRRLAELIDRQSALISAGDWDGFDTLESDLRAVIAALPLPAPAEAAGILNESQRRLRVNEDAITRAMQASRRQLGELGRGRRMLRGYLPPRPARYLDLRG